MAFYVGQKVVCIKEGEWSNRYPGETDPARGDVLTIREVVALPTEGGAFFRFKEIRNPSLPLRTEAAYWSVHFRPVVEKGTDAGVEALKKLVAETKAPTPQPEEVV